MKVFTQHINEWKINDQSSKNVELDQKYFIYYVKQYGNIKLFDQNWNQLNDYYDKVFDENDNQVKLNPLGWTNKEYDTGPHKFYIKDIDDIRECRYMFYYCEELESIPFFNISKVDSLYRMCQGCSTLKHIPLFNTKNIKSIECAFSKCEKLESVPKFDLSKCENMRWAFDTCFSLKEIPLFKLNKM